jgi:ribosomal protein L7/L12
MISTCWRAAAAALTMCCGLLLAMPWQAAQAAPVVFEKATANGTSDDPGRFTAELLRGSNGSQALLQLLTAAEPGSRISGLYFQDATGAIGRDTVSGYPLAQLSQTQIYEVLLNDPGPRKIAVIKTLTDTLGISLSQAKALVDSAPVVIRTAFTSDGNDQLKQSLENAGATVTLASHQDPSVPAGTNVGVTMPGSAPTGYDVVLTSAGGNKVSVIKAVRDLTGLGLTEAKKLVDDAPSVIKANVNRADAIAARQALQDSGAVVALNPIGTGGTAGHIALPPGSTGIVPDMGWNFDYQDPSAMPPLQLTLDLDISFTDLLAAWEDGQFLLGLKVTDAAGVSDLYLAAVAAPPSQVSEPSTIALLSLPLLALLLGARTRRKR